MNCVALFLSQRPMHDAQHKPPHAQVRVTALPEREREREREREQEERERERERDRERERKRERPNCHATVPCPPCCSKLEPLAEAAPRQETCGAHSVQFWCASRLAACSMKDAKVQKTPLQILILTNTSETAIGTPHPTTKAARAHRDISNIV